MVSVENIMKIYDLVVWKLVHKSNKSTTLENDIICYKADMFVWTCHKLVNLSFKIKLGNRKIKAGTLIKVVIY